MKFITTLLTGILLLCGHSGNAQNKKLVSAISKEICNCLEKYDNLKTQVEIESAMESCIMKTSMKNIESIKKELGIDMTSGELASRQFGEIIAYDLIKKCDIFLKYIMMVSTDNITPEDSTGEYEELSVLNPDLVPYERFSTDTMTAQPSSCLELHNAKFVYVTDNPDKTDYFVLAGKKCTEYHDNGKYVSHYTIHWKNECEYVSVFNDSTNPEINNLLTKGDKIYYQIIGTYKDTVYINLDYKGFSKTFTMHIQK